MTVRILPLLAAALMILGCTGTMGPGAAPQTGTQTASPAGFRNVQVLPRDLTREQLIAVMRSFNRALGVRCNHCHVVTATTPKEELDFPSDAKEEKRVARVMIQMTQQINTAWLERVEQAEGHHEAAEATAAVAPAQWRVHCWTCHRGHTEPEQPPPPPAPQQPQQ
jgi:Photosynthetic reaction centre cytochrome C subunit